MLSLLLLLTGLGRLASVGHDSNVTSTNYSATEDWDRY